MKASPIKAVVPESGRVLVLSPHIDDDVIGAGGCLIKHIRAGDFVKVVYFADCTEARVREAEEAAAIIGVRDLEFLGLESKRLLECRGLDDKLSAILKDFNPDILYLPSLFDRHNDHLAVNHLLAAVHSRFHFDFTVCAFEVWTALVPNLIIDITDSVAEKKQALLKYSSQLTANDWLDAALSINRFRGVTSGAGTYAEGFMRYSIKEYFRIWQTVYGK
jgi:LmbE family N-acetylglucosaminyl deacetylase